MLINSHTAVALSRVMEVKLKINAVRGCIRLPAVSLVQRLQTLVATLSFPVLVSFV